MKMALAIAAACGLLLAAAQARSGGEAVPAERELPPPDWSEWTRPLGTGTRPAGPTRAATAAQTDTAPAAAPEAIALEDIDVVDAHWMALTMWGEARNQGEEGMRAVGHVIDNRRRARSHGRYATETVSAAWQFSCWNRGDPNRAKMLAIEDLPRDSEGWAQWLQAKRLAAKILAGRSADPTGGALFYHTTGVQPAWSAGVSPVARIGDHLFFRTAA